MTASDVLLIERPSDDIVVFRLNRPQVRNALNLEIRQRLADGVTQHAADPAIRCLVITGSDMSPSPPAPTSAKWRRPGPVEVMARNVQKYWRTIMDCPKPVIAAIEGFALGGGLELALCADIIVAGEGARLGLPEVKVGILPGGGGTQKLARLVGRQRAMLLLMTGKLFSAAEALNMGVVSEVAPTGQALPRALEIAREIAAHAADLRHADQGNRQCRPQRAARHRADAGAQGAASCNSPPATRRKACAPSWKNANRNSKGSSVDLLKSDLVAAVFGTGTMGRGIAQVCAQAGMTTLLYDAREGAVKEAIAGIDKALEGLVAKGRMTAEVKQGVIGRLKPIGSLDEVAPAGVVIEAIVEDLAVKRELFRELEKRLAPDAVIATNTSSLSVTEIAAGCAKPERVAGLHFFNPPPLMRLVEVIGGLRTDPAVVEGLIGFSKRITKHPVVAADSPGFIVNHAGRAYAPEALRIVAQGIATPREVDTLMKEAAGFRMGPFELLDLVGGDVAHAVMVSIYNQYFNEPMYQPSAQMAVRVAGGLLGRKSKQGFYDYSGPPSAGAPTVTVAPQPMPAAAWICDEDGGAELAEWLKAAGVKAQFGGAPAASALCFVTPLGEDASSAAVRLKLDPDAHGRRRHARPFPGPPHADEDAADRAGNAGRGLYRAVGRQRAGHRDQRQPRLRHPAAALHDRQYRQPHRRTAHRRAGRHRYRGRARAQLSERPAGARRHAGRRPRAGGARRHAFRHARSEISRDRLAAPPRAARHLVAVARLRVRAGGPEPCRSMPKPWFSCATPCGASCASG